MRCLGFLWALFGGLFLAACSDGTGPQAPIDCTEASPQVLAVGEHRILDPTQDGACLRLAAAGDVVTEYLYVPVATEGRETSSGVSAPYRVHGSSPAAAAILAQESPLLLAFQRPLPARVFHGLLRSRERALSQSSAVVPFEQGLVTSAETPPPVVGEQRTFNVLKSSDVTGASPDDYVQSIATARSVGDRIAIFVDNAAPTGGYTDADLADLATLFDDRLYPIDTLAFGSESDVDQNGVVIVVLTHLVNALSPDCDSTQSVVLGYFFGADVLPRSSRNPGSNQAEVFFGLVPDPTNTRCGITEAFALSHLPGTFIHEFQHMISFNQHRLVRGASSEDTWLNEGLSHFAEELAGLQIPDAECPSGSCFDDFLARGNLSNALSYLASPEEYFLIEPGSSTGTLPERGANWLFVRWLVDHFAADSLLGTDLTRRLVGTSLVGHVNVATQTGIGFSILVPEWQLTNYLDDLPGFSQPAARLRYKTWNFRQEAASRLPEYPLVPDSTSGAGYAHRGVLRAGSGRHIRVVQAPGAGEVDIQVTGRLGPKGLLIRGPLPSSIDPRVALVRIR